VVFSAGFGEISAEGGAAQARLAARCRQAGIRMLGPNCLGLASFASGAFSTFSHSLEFADVHAGRIAVVSQSGAVGTYAVVKGARRGLRFSRFVATGNEADIDVADCIEWLAGDPETGVIVGHLESCRDGRRLAAALEAARAAGKPVALLKGGASEAGRTAAASHTGALAGLDAVYDAAFAATGTARARGIDELLDIAYACSLARPPVGRRIGMITVSGGFGVMAADAAAVSDIVLPPLPAKARERIRDSLPFAATANPVDVTPQVLNDFSLLPAALTALLDEGPYDIIVAFLGTLGLDPHLIDNLVAAAVDVRRRYPDRPIALSMMTTPAARAALEAEGIPVFEDIERLVKAVSHLAAIGEGLARGPALPALPKARTGGLKGPVSETDAKKLLAGAGIPFVAERLAPSAEAAVAAAAELGAPVALKVVSADIQHKTELGGVLLGLSGREDIAAGFDTLMARARAAFPKAPLEGVSVAPMVEGGVETVLGSIVDQDFGPVVMFGLGGVHAEVLKDVALRLAPVDARAARGMIEQIRGYPLLAGVRGRRPVDLDAVAEAIVALSRFAAERAGEITSIDINPFIALEEGAVGVDALIVTHNDAGADAALAGEIEA